MVKVESIIDNVKNYKVITNGNGEVGVVYFKYKKALISDLLFYTDDKESLRKDLSICKPNKYYKFISWEGYKGVSDITLTEIIKHVTDYTDEDYCFI